MPARDGFCPYIGLSPYSAEYTAYFFGRESEQSVIASNLYASPLTVLYGSSGVGKSSLLRAGVTPHLATLERTAALYFNRWKEASFLDALKAELVATLRRATDDEVALDPGLAFDSMVEKAAREFGGSILILFDQFEDYLLYMAGTEAAGEFDRQLARVVSRRDLDAGLLIAIREDWLSKLRDHFKLRLPVLQNTLQLQRMEAARAQRAITGPLEVYNQVHAPPDGQVEIEDSLVQKVLEETESGKVRLNESGGAGAPRNNGKGRIELSFLQLVMTKLWEAEAEAGSNVLRADTLERLGGVEKIVRDHVGIEMKKQTPDEQDLCARMFHLLVMPSGTKIAQRIDDLAGEVRMTADDVRPVLEKLSAGRILSRSEPPERYEVFHDVLAPAVLDWRIKYQEEQERKSAALKLEEQKRNARRFFRLSMMLLAALVLAVVAGTWAWVRERQSRSRELAAAALSDLRVDPERGILLALHALRSSRTAEAEDALHRAVLASRVRQTFRTGDCALLRAAPSGDGTRTAGACGDGSVRVWDQAGVEVLRRPAHTGEARVVAFSADGGRVASGGEDGAVRVWDAASGNIVAEIPGNGPSIAAIAFSGDGTRVASGDLEGAVGLWDAATGARVKDFTGHEKAIQGIAFDPDGMRLATASLDGSVRLWSIERGKEESQLFQSEAPAWGVAFNGDGDLLAAAIGDRSVRVWKVDTGVAIHTLRGHGKMPVAVAFSRDGNQLASAGYDNTARIWDRATGNELAMLAGHTGAAHAVWFSGDGKRVATGSLDGTIRTWDAGRSAERLAIESTAAINWVAYDRAGNRMATASADRTVRIWDGASGAEQAMLLGHYGDVWQAVFSADGQKLASAAKDFTARIWSVAAGRELLSLPHPTEWVHSVAFRPDGGAVLTGAYDGHARLWDASTGSALADVDAHPRVRVERVAFRPDGSRWATAGEDGTAIVWDAGRQAPLKTLRHGADVRALAFHPDGTRLATGGIDRRVVVWDVESGRAVRMIGDHPQEITALDFDRSGERLATGDAAGTVRVWDAGSGRRLLMLMGHQGSVTAVAFSPDGKSLASSGEDGAVRVYVTRLEDLTVLARERARRPLTAGECRQFLHADRCPPSP